MSNAEYGLSVSAKTTIKEKCNYVSSYSAHRGTETRLANLRVLDWERDLKLHWGARSEMATRYVPGATSIEIPLRDTDEVQ